MHFGVVAGSTPVAHYPSQTVVICGGGSSTDISQHNARGNIKQLELCWQETFHTCGVGAYLCHIDYFELGYIQ